MMKFKKIIIIMLSLLFLIGCSAENTTYPNGGDNGNNSGNEGNNGDTIPVKDKIEDYAGNWEITFQEDQLPDRPGGNIIIADDGSLTYPTVLGDKNINVDNNEIKCKKWQYNTKNFFYGQSTWNLYRKWYNKKN